MSSVRQSKIKISAINTANCVVQERFENDREQLAEVVQGLLTGCIVTWP